MRRPFRFSLPWLIASLVAAGALACAGTTSATTEESFYDIPGMARVGVHELVVAGPNETPLIVAPDGIASRSVVARGLSTTPIPRSVATNTAGPNPYGKVGGPAHQAGVQDVVSDIESRGLTAQQEVRFETPGGIKNSRYADVGAYDAEGNLAEVHQVGRQTMGGLPVARERGALVDIMNNVIRTDQTGVGVYFHPYN